MKRMMALVLAFIMTFMAAWSDPSLFMNVQAQEDGRRVENLRSDEYLLQITGNCSISNNSYDELEVTCRVGEDKYQKHFLHISNETTYTIEQLEYSDVSKYDYEIVFRPEAIIPITIETEIG